MLNLLFTLWMLSPMAQGGNGHHFGWRNNQPRTVPAVQTVTPPPSGGSGGVVGGTPSETKRLPITYSEN